MTDQDFADLHTLRTHLMATCQWALKAGRYGIFEAINDAIAGINGTDGFLEYQRRTVKPQEAATLTIEPIDLSNTRAATIAMNLLADAAERAAKALHELDQKQHCGVSVVTAGQVTQMEIKPQVHHMGKIGEAEEYRPAIPYQEKIKPRTVRDEMGRSLDGGASGLLYEKQTYANVVFSACDALNDAIRQAQGVGLHVVMSISECGTLGKTPVIAKISAPMKPPF